MVNTRGAGSGPGGEAAAAQRIDFARLAAELLAGAETLVPSWLPDGKREGSEWKCGSLSGGAGHSCSVNLRTGQWADFATEDKGGDLVSLYASIHGMSQIDAARELVERHNLGAVVLAGAARPDPVAPKRPPSEWVTVLPVPAIAPEPSFVHPFRGLPHTTWRYERDGALLGYVCRFTASDGGKEILPLTWCQNLRDGTMRWHWKAWDEPRPLYLPGGTLRQPVLDGDAVATPAPPVAIVEGEKCALALHQVLGAEFDVVSWPNGGEAVDKAAWAWLAGRRCIVWADSDAARRKPTREERAAGVDPDTLPYMPSDKQKGHKAATELVRLLLQQGCEVYLVPFLEPGDKPHGWDCADAIAGIGVEAPWGADELRGYLRTAKRVHAPVAGAAGPRGGISTPTNAGAGGLPAISDEGVIRWWPHYGKSGPLATRENVVHAMRVDPVLAGCLGLNEFSHQVAKLRTVPWDAQRVGALDKWQEVDDLLLGEYLVHTHDMPSIPRTVLEEALRVIAHENRYHPIRARWRALQWDGVERLADWLFYATGINEGTCPRRQYEYLRRVGKWYIMGMVRRIFHPGCKFDYMLVLEGPQGYRKSTLGKVLAGEYFSDTQLNLGDKDSYLQLQGRLLHEFSELHALANKDVTLVKAFISAQVDYLRAPFDRRPAEYARQCVFFGTSNNPRWARDRTGNRRFWPVKIEQPVDTDWVAANLDQMFAEALRLVDAGERCFPTYEEELEYFQPEQASRVQTTVSEEALFQYLCGSRDFKGGTELPPPDNVTLIRCLEGMGLDLAKSAGNRALQNEVVELLHKWGWHQVRSSKKVNGVRPWVYVAPPVWPPQDDVSDKDLPHTQADQPENDDDVPF